jgi:hypothetical protein
VRFILERNIIWGDALTLKTVGERPGYIVFSEWSPVNGSMLNEASSVVHAQRKRAGRWACPFLMFYVTAEAVTHKACAWLCALTIDTMRQNPSELTLRAELTGRSGVSRFSKAKRAV